MSTSRREFLKAGCGVMAGAAVVGALTITGNKKAEATPAQHPYGYIPLNVESTRQLGYNSYKGIILADGKQHAHCSFATFHAIISQIAELDSNPDSPYKHIPTQMMEWGSGGVVGFGSFCGAVNGACAAIGIICGNADATKFISDLLTWYTGALLPTNIIAPTGVLPQSVSDTTLCHASVTNWCRASGYASGSTERSERCARLAGDVAAKAVEMLNSGVPVTLLPTPSEKTVCVSCHYQGTNYAAGQFTRGKENCTVCHSDLKQVPPTGHKWGGK